MNCPNCGSKIHSESEVCIQCRNLPARILADKSAPHVSTRALLEQCYSGRRNTIVGLLLLCGAGLIMLAIISKGSPPFLAFLWTCWMFLGGMIAFAEGSVRWLSSHRQIKALASASSRHPSGPRTGTDSDEAGGQGQIAAKAQPAEGERPIDRRTLLDNARSR